ncbi:tetratricopeptide repeat protein [Pulveribacter sp.]|uniref:tetratricopeptide repeat protein n=1 Tax=Pulveribacter sp. TaxID=2678893 RepID=UPI0028977CD5|nr:tetratricopeptide repeat protein [Pulveribacter sp.]
MTDTPRLFAPLDDALLQRALPLLDDEWLQRDADLAPVLPIVLARGVGQDWHKAGTFRHHLVGVARSLALWQQPRDVRLLGLLHSVYGNAFVDLVKFDAASERQRLQGLVGEEAEHLVHLFCTMSRAQFVQKVLAGEVRDDGSLQVELNGAAPRQSVRLSAYEVAAFTIVSMADTIEQWFSWQDEIYSRFPGTDTSRRQAVHWGASLWPGPMRPTARMVSQVAALGRALHHPALAGQLPLPPVFDGCREALAPRDEAAACALYWSVVQLAQPLVDLDAATATLEQAVQLNPWVGEPQMVLAQLYLSAGRGEDAERAANGALQQFCTWGNSWDKRVQWDAWVAWTRILLQSANQGTWPERLDKLNNLALR